MQRFPCPFCGPRDETEFHYGGDAGKLRPDRSAGPRESGDADWAAYRYVRKNPKGRARELWLHAAGCGRWIVIERDTLTHAVIGTESPL